MSHIPEHTLKELEAQLLKKAELITEQLKNMASQDKKVAGDWDTRFQKFDPKSGLEENADEVEEYATNLPIEHALELDLQAIRGALERIKNGTYDVCKTCGQAIDIERLKAFPEAQTCMACEERRPIAHSSKT